jgi:hypothetical protein
MWKIDPKDKCVHKYKHVFNSGTFEENRGRREMKRE